MIALPELTPARPMRVLGTRLLVKLAKPSGRTASGLWLPATASRSLSQGEVVARGHKLDPWTAAWVGVGAHVLFSEHAAQPVTKDEVSVYADDLLGLILEEEEGGTVLLPANDWVLIDRDGTDQRSRGGVLLPESARQRARSGRIRDIGPGKLTDKGRLPVHALVNLAEGLFQVGTVLYWSSRAEVVTVTSAGEDCCLIRGGDLDVAEVEG